MRFWAGREPGHYRIFANAKEVGYVRPGVVGFGGFATQANAVAAGAAAYRALTDRRVMARERRGVVVDWPSTNGHRRPPAVVAPSSALGDWGFEVPLEPQERAAVFSTSRARTMWRALREAGEVDLMRQFKGPPAMTESAGGPLRPAHVTKPSQRVAIP
ncbi:MAG: hypothetical protein ABI647_09380 [Gemmatimonadota bacterium]